MSIFCTYYPLSPLVEECYDDRCDDNLFLLLTPFLKD